MFERTLKLVALLYLLWLTPTQATTLISSARVWPAQDYTRLTLESKQSVSYTLFTIKDPERLVIDLEDIELNNVLKNLTSKIGNDDPYIKSVRVGRFKPGVVRLVLDLKAEAKPQLFELKPVAEYGYRLVLDVYPAKPIDPLMALLQPGKAAPVTPDSSAPDSQKPVAPEATPKLSTSTTLGTTETSKPSAQPKSRAEFTERTLIIAIDAGHGGEDPGAHGSGGALEKNVTLAIARRLKKLVDAQDGMRGVLIRDGDYFIPLGGRTAKARAAHADLFVSIHADAFINPEAHGSSVFALSEHGATSAAARWLAKKENEADLIGGVNIAVKDPYLARTLLDLSQTATINDSLKLAKHVLGELSDINALHRGHVEQAGFAVLKSPDIPSILVETAFISNPEEEHRLTDDNYQDKLANAVLSGVKRYLSQNPPLMRMKMAER
jgi:N-acetylmuramoyl-L-alanine amidase